MSAPSVSVVMPVYNAERYVGEAVQSILDQSLSEFEFLIFDDGSTDGSLEILRDFARSDPRVRLSAGEHTSYLAWLNRGVELARGEFLARMDADDVAMPERFARQRDYLRAHLDCVAVGSSYLMIDAAGDPISPRHEPLTHEEIDRLHLGGGGGGARIAHPSVMMRTGAVRAIGGYRKAYEAAEDLDLFLRLAERGRLANLPEVLLKYRIHPASVGVSRRAEQLKKVSELIEDAHRRRGLPLPEGLLESLPAPSSTAGDVRAWVVAQARSHGYLATARRHAWAALRARPWSRGSWRLLKLAWLGR
jgi:glycosyltransferase involved in cell wall biosynthesis